MSVSERQGDKPQGKISSLCDIYQRVAQIN
jgi:hypothetical protein